MKKDFAQWNKKKTFLHHEKERPFFHVRLIDGKRLHYKMGNVASGDFVEIKKRIKQLLA